MEDPDQADKYYKEEFKKIQDYHSQTTKSFLAKRSLDAFLQKQAVEDSILIRNSSTNNLLERNRLAVEANTDRLKKSIVYGKTDLEISNAQNELNTILESDVYNRVYGKKAAEEKNKVREDVDYYKGLRTLDRDPAKINDVVANSTLPIELTYFNVIKNDTYNEINWHCSTEINNNYFTIERSNDALNWEILSL
jgi:hypothetical protein